MPRNLKPNLIIIAGPNGSGKTTITEQGLGHDWFEGCAYINPDNIAQSELGDWNNADNSLEAAKRATALRYELLSAKKSIAFETVFCQTKKLISLSKQKNKVISFDYFLSVRRRRRLMLLE